MPVVLIQILLFCCVPVGIYLLVKGIRIIKKSVSGAIMLEISYAQQRGEFAVTADGYFSIWQKSPLLSRTPADQYRPVVYHTGTGLKVPLSRSLSGVQANNFADARMEMFTFFAQAGNYMLQLEAGSGISGLQRVVSSLIPFTDGGAGLSRHFLQVRKSQPQVYLFLAVPVILCGAAGVIGGLVLGLLADQIF